MYLCNIYFYFYDQLTTHKRQIVSANKYLARESTTEYHNVLPLSSVFATAVINHFAGFSSFPLNSLPDALLLFPLVLRHQEHPQIHIHSSFSTLNGTFPASRTSCIIAPSLSTAPVSAEDLRALCGIIDGFFRARGILDPTAQRKFPRPRSMLRPRDWYLV